MTNTLTQITCTISLHRQVLNMTSLYTEEQEERAAMQDQVARKKRKRGNNILLSTKYLGCMVT